MLYKHLFSILFGHLNLNQKRKKIEFAGYQSNRPVNRSNRPVSRSEPIARWLLNSNLNLTDSDRFPAKPDRYTGIRLRRFGRTGRQVKRCVGDWRTAPPAKEAVFSFLYLKKIKISKIYMSVLENFKNIPRSPYGGATGPKCNFFLQICNEVPGRGRAGGRGACRPPSGDRGPVAPPLGRLALPLLYKHSTLIPSSFEPKNSEKKRGVRRREVAKPCQIAHLWSAG